MVNKRTTKLWAMILSIVMVLSLIVVPASAARSMGGEEVAETPAIGSVSGAAPLAARPAGSQDDVEAELLDASGKVEVDVWDFGAEQLADTDTYHFVNHLTVASLNGIYPQGTEVGPKSTLFPTADVTFDATNNVKWIGQKAEHHSLLSANEALISRQSRKFLGIGEPDPYMGTKYMDSETDGAPRYMGEVYSNSGSSTNVYLTIDLQAGDVLTAMVTSNGTDSVIEFRKQPTTVTDAAAQEGTIVTTQVFTGGSSETSPMTFYAPETGTYSLDSLNEKLCVVRMYRQHASEVTVSGTVTEAEGMPASYSVIFTNAITGVETTMAVTNKAFSGTLLAPYSYDVTLGNATGFAVLEGSELVLAAGTATATHPVTVQAIDRAAVTGTITGLDSTALSKLQLLFTPTGDGIVYTPVVTVDNGAYSTNVEKGMPHAIEVKGINDYEITAPAKVTDLTWDADAEVDLTFAKKATYDVTIVPTGLELSDLADATFTFTKLDEAGDTEDETAVPYNPYDANKNPTGAKYNYVYTFTGTSAIKLRDGVYNMAVTGMNGEQKATPNVVVNGAAVNAPVSFTTAPITEWSFKSGLATENLGANAPTILGRTATWKTLEIDATASGAKVGPNGGNYIQFNTGTIIKIPVAFAEPGETIKLSVAAYYNGKTKTLKVGTAANAPTNEGGTQDVDMVFETEVDADGYVTIVAIDNDYLTHIKIEPAVPTYPTSWDFLTGSGAANAAYPAKTLNGIQVTDNGTNFKTHGESSGFGAAAKNTTIKVPVSGPCTLTMLVGNSYDVTFPDGVQLKVTGSVPKKTPLTYEYTTEEAGTVDIVCGGGATTYINSISVEYPTPKYYQKNIKFTDNDLVNEYTTSKKGEFNTLMWTEARSHSKNLLYASANSTLTLPVAGKCAITVTANYAGKFKIADQAEWTAQSSGGDFSTTYNYNGDATGFKSGVVITVGDTDTYFKSIEVVYDSTVDVPEPPVVEDIVLKVDKTGADGAYTTINEALAAANATVRQPGQRITIEIAPGDYEEMLYITTKDVTLKNKNADSATLALTDKGVHIGSNEVRITWYYGHGYTYYSMTKGHRYDAEVLAVNKANGYASYVNAGSGTTDGSYWNASVRIAADGFRAEGIIFENSFNQYVSAASVEDVIEAQGSAEEGGVPRASMKTVGDTTVQMKEYVERAGAVSVVSGSTVWFDHCAFVGRQDVLYGPEGCKMALYNCDIYGGTDFIYGPMVLVAAKCNLILNTSENNNDVAYITAPQQKSGHGYLMYNCTIKSPTPGVNTASTLKSKPCYFGRPWQGQTGEAIFLNTNIEHTDPSFIGADIGKDGKVATASLIMPGGWNSSLGGTSDKCGEYNTIECCTGVDNSNARESWAKVLTQSEAEAYTVAAFLGDWDAFAGKDMTVTTQTKHEAITGETLPTKVTVNASKKTLAVGEKLELTATVDPDNANQNVTWSSSDVSVLTVDADGKVTAIGGGTASITARSANGMISGSVKITVNIPVTGVTLNKETISIGAGRNTTLTATVAPANATDASVTFTSSKPAVATVDANGKVRAVANGETTITVTTTDGNKTATCVVTVAGGEDAVIAAVTAVTLTDGEEAAAASYELEVDDVKTLGVVIAPETAEQDFTVTGGTADVEAVKSANKVIITAKAVTTEAVTITVTSTGKNADDEAVTATVAITVKEAEPDDPVEPEKTPAEKLADAIKAATTLAEDTQVSEDGTDVRKGVMWVDEDTMGDFTDAIETAQAVLDDEDATKAEILAAIEALQDAQDAFEEAQKEGTKPGSSLPPAYGSGTKPSDAGVTKTETVTNANGDTVATVTDPNGDKTLTVTDEDGEVLAEVEIPATVTGGKVKFVDVPDDHWAAKSINNMADLGMVKGVSEDTYDMNSGTTRGAVATMFFRLAGEKAIGESTYADVAAGDWFADGVAWATKAGVVTGYSADAFGPNDTITRQQLAVMAARFAKLLGIDVTKANDSVLGRFTDGAEVDDWAVEGMSWCISAGIFQGKGDGTVDPKAEVTRAETAVVFDRLVALIAGK